MSDEVFNGLRAEVLAFPRRYASEAYPIDLRRRLQAAASELVESGMSWRGASKVLGVRSETLTRWASRPAPSEPATFLPVRVVREGGRGPALLTIVSPNGWRIEGLALRDALELLRSVG